MSSAAAPEPGPQRRQTSALRRRVGVGVVILVAAVAVAVGRAGRWEQREPTRPPQVPAQVAVTSSLVSDSSASMGSRPSKYGARPLSGVPLQGPTGLRLLISGDPVPIVLDVDRGTIRPITGLPASSGRLVRIEVVGEDAVVVAERPRPANDPPRVADIFWVRFWVRHGGNTATRLGVGADAAASTAGRGVWLLSYQDKAKTRCVLSQVALDGRQRRPGRPMSCQTRLGAELPGGAGLLIDDGSALVHPDGGVVGLYGQGLDAQPAGGNFVLGGAEAGEPITLADVGGGARWRLGWPSRLDAPPAGMGLVRAHPDGRRAVVGFGDPADPGPEQTLDAWLLDLTTRRWQQLPDMSARVALKAADMRWTADGRLVILAELVEAVASEQRTVLVGVWRPGEPRIAVRQVTLSQATAGNFVLW